MSARNASSTIVTGLLALGLALGGAMVLLTARALGSVPEAPLTEPASEITPSSARLNGVLNPGATSKVEEASSWQFFYAPSSAGCTGGSEAPQSPVLSIGNPKEAVSTLLTGLQPSSTYSFCAVARNLVGEPVMGNAVPFTTLGLRPSIDGVSASSVGAQGATLQAQVNPNNQATTFAFEYATSEAKLGTNEANTLTGVTALQGYGDQTASVATAALQAGTTYYYRVLTTNTAGTSEGKAQSFTTVPMPHTEPVPVSVITGTSATFSGTLTPLNQTIATEYYFAYYYGTGCLGFGTAPQSAGTGSGSKTVTASTTELEPSTEYSVCLVASNSLGGFEVASPPVPFTTPALAPAVEEEPPSGLTPIEATLQARINPNNQETAYFFEYASSEAALLEGKGTKLERASQRGFGYRFVGASTGQVLSPNTSYFYRVLLENASHEKAQGAVEEFKTPAFTAPAIESEATAGITPFEATLIAHGSPDYQKTTACEFEYATSQAAIGTAGATRVDCRKPLASEGPGEEASVSLASLAAKTAYWFRLVVSNGTGTSTGAIEKFETLPAEPPLVLSSSQRAATLNYDNARVEASVYPDYQETTCVIEYAEQASQLGTGSAKTLPCPGSLARSGEFESTGPVDLGHDLTPETKYFFRFVATNGAGTTHPEPSSFTTLTAPVVTTGAAQGVTRTTATLSGTVNPSGVQTNYHYVYATAQEYAKGLAESPEDPYVYGRSTPEVPIGSEDAAKATEALQVGSLAPGTLYHYTVVAVTTQATEEVGTAHATLIGPDQSFQTAPAIPPSVSGASVSGITQNGARISATVEGQGLSTRWEVLLGDSPGTLEHQASGQNEGAPEAVSAGVESLMPGTTYYYRVLVLNPDGTRESPEGSFTTLPAPPHQTLPLAVFPQFAPLGVPANAFVTQAAPGATLHTGTLTNAQKLKAALRACGRKPAGKRASCKRSARRRYGAKAKSRHAGRKG